MLYFFKKYRDSESAFALPAVVIASLVMMMVLVSGANAALGGQSDLKQQYYDQLVESAGDAGLTYARYCLAKGGTIVWPLTPQKNCDGTAISCTSECDVMNDTVNNLRSSFSVSAPNADKVIKSVGRLDILRASNGAPIKVESLTRSQLDAPRVPAQVSVSMAQLTDRRATVFLSSNGKAYGMGDNQQNRFSDNAPSSSITNIPREVDLPPGVDFVKRTIGPGYGLSFFCIIGSNDSLYCRGAESLPENSPLRSIDGWQKLNLPAGVTVDTSYADTYNQDASRSGAMHGISVAIYNGGQICVVGSDGNAYCVGGNSSGELANGRLASALASITLEGYTRVGTTTSTSPVTVYPVSKPAAITKVVSVITRSGVTCIQGLPDTTKVYCAGRNEYGQLGRGSTGGTTVAAHATPAPVNIPSGIGITQVLPSNNASTTAFVVFLGTNGTIYGTGSNASYALGGSTSSLQYSTPVAITTMTSTNKLIMTGTVHIAGIRADGSVYTIGTNNNRQLGNNSATNSAVAQRFILDNGEVADYVKMRNNTDIWYNAVYQTVILTKTNKVFSAGQNLFGQFGAALGPQISYPKQFLLPTGLTAQYVSSDGYANMCVLASNQKIYCAGSNNSGQLGDGSTVTNSNSPVQTIMPTAPVYY